MIEAFDSVVKSYEEDIEELHQEIERLRKEVEHWCAASAWRQECEAYLFEIERLRGSISEALEVACRPYYGDKYQQLGNYNDAILILEKALERK